MILIDIAYMSADAIDVLTQCVWHDVIFSAYGVANTNVDSAALQVRKFQNWARNEIW